MISTRPAVQVRFPRLDAGARFHSVIRSVRFRVLAHLLAFGAAFAAPMAALGHGYAHHRDAGAEHSSHDQHALSAPVHEAADPVAAVETPEGEGAHHAHPVLDCSMSKRATWSPFVAIVLRTFAVLEYRAEPAAVPASESGHRPGDLTHAPPPPSRAPPTRLS